MFYAFIPSYITFEYHLKAKRLFITTQPPSIALEGIRAFIIANHRQHIILTIIGTTMSDQWLSQVV